MSKPGHRRVAADPCKQKVNYHELLRPKHNTVPSLIVFKFKRKSESNSDVVGQVRCQPSGGGGQPRRLRLPPVAHDLHLLSHQPLTEQ